jgi:hypothetical protein
MAFDLHQHRSAHRTNRNNIAQHQCLTAARNTEQQSTTLTVTADSLIWSNSDSIFSSMSEPRNFTSAFANKMDL